MRVVGRLCVPMWFFLVGYARSRDMSVGLWVGFILIESADLLFGHPFLSFNILTTILVTRFLLDRFALDLERGALYFWGMVGILFLLAFPTMSLLEYGTQGLLLAFFGYMVRRRQDRIFSDNRKFEIFVAAYCGFGVMQCLYFGFDLFHSISLMIGLIFVFAGLFSFRRIVFEGSSKIFGASLIRFMGRHTLVIYVVHLIFLKAIVWYMYPDKYDGLLDKVIFF